MRMTALKRLRKERGWTREKLAAEAEVSIFTIRAHERGEVQGVENRTAEALARALHVEKHTLFFPDDTVKNVQAGESPEGSVKSA